MFRHLRGDIRAALDRDPAARSALEVLLCHPVGYHRFFFKLPFSGTGRRTAKQPRMRLIVDYQPDRAVFLPLEIHPGAV